MPRPIPVFLQDYDVFRELEAWKSATSVYAGGRSWEIRSYGSGGIVICSLRWSLRDQVAGLDRAGTSAVKVVWSAIEEFRRLEALDGRKPRPVQEGPASEPARAGGQAEA